MSQDPTIFSRWSQRKRAVAAEQAAADSAEKAASEAREAPPPENPPELSDADWLQQEGLPQPEDLQQGDDFTAFLKTGVPEALRKRALRSLWRSNPVLANLDGLIDHGEDYTDAAMVPETMNTLYQVGKGMLRAVVQDPQPEETDQVAASTVPAQGTETNGINQEKDLPEMPRDFAHSDTADQSAQAMNAEEQAPEEPEEKPLQPRRMAFRQV